MIFSFKRCLWMLLIEYDYVFVRGKTEARTEAGDSFYNSLLKR